MTAKQQCPFCGSSDLKYEEKTLDPVFLTIKAYVLAISAVRYSRKCIMRCTFCGYETEVVQKKKFII